MNKLNLFQIARMAYKPSSPKNIIKRIKFVKNTKAYELNIYDFIHRLAINNITVSSEMLRTVEWPYIHNQWDIKTKLDTIATHYEILTKKHKSLTLFDDTSSKTLFHFDHISSGVSIVIDRPKWFIREGELVLNIFRDDVRVASMAFTLAKEQDNIVAYVGAVQGISSEIPSEASLNIYKQLSKDFFGLRPKSLLLNVLKVVLFQFEVKKILGVSDKHRHHRHSYFGNDDNTEFKNNYDQFWEEHDGILQEDTGFYQLPITPAIKDLTQVASKKRAMYRRRNEFIESLSTANIWGNASLPLAPYKQ